MALFRKRVPELIDLTELRRKGILQRSESLAENNSKEILSDEVLDLSSFQPKQEQQKVQSSEVSSVLGDFLSGLASANSAEETSIPTPDISSLKNGSNEVKGLKIKIEDLEFKFDNLVSRLAKLEEKIGNKDI